MAIKVLFTSWNAYSAVQPQADRTVGGLETASWAFARQLAGTGRFKVLFGVRVDRSPHQLDVDGVLLVPIALPLRKLRNSIDQDIRINGQFPWLEVRRWNSALLWKVPLLAMGRLIQGRLDWMQRTREVVQRLQPDLIVTFGVNDDTVAALDAARSAGIPGLLWLQSNADVNEKIFTKTDELDAYGVSRNRARTCFENATQILCQTESQQVAIKPFVTVPAELVRSPVDTAKFFPPTEGTSRDAVFWVGRYDRFHKRPLLALEVARKCPDIPFLFVINPGFVDVEEEVREQLPPNVTLLDYLPHDKIPEAFRRAKLFLSTGSREFEGFPNVFLEAAASGTPVCALEDFDHFLKRSQAGACAAGNVDRLAEQIRSLWNDDARWQVCSRNGPAYVREHHSLSATLTRVAGILEEMARQATPA